MKKIAIIGGGISGAVIGYILKQYASVTIFEKSRGMGGRISTKYANPYSFDHGSPYFTACTMRFKDFIQPLIDTNVIQKWNLKHTQFDGNQTLEKKTKMDNSHYIGLPSMSTICKHLTSGIRANLKTKIVKLQRKSQWQLIDAENYLYDDFDWVVTTCPPSQTLDLLPKNFQHCNEIKSIKLFPCCVLLLGFSTNLSMDFEVANITNSYVSRIVVNNQKPERKKMHTLVIYSSTEYAQICTSIDKNKIIEQLCTEVERVTGHCINHAEYKAIHIWKYAQGTSEKNNPIFIDYQINCAACGDWCLGNSVEAAFTSAYMVAKKIKENIKL